MLVNKLLDARTHEIFKQFFRQPSAFVKLRQDSVCFQALLCRTFRFKAANRNIFIYSIKMFRTKLFSSLFRNLSTRCASHCLLQVVVTSLGQAVNYPQQVRWHYQTCYKIVQTSLIQVWCNNVATNLAT